MIEATEFDAKFDQRENITEFLDFSQAERAGQAPKKVNVDFPAPQDLHSRQTEAPNALGRYPKDCSS